jgi:hypothetical protein
MRTTLVALAVTLVAAALPAAGQRAARSEIMDLEDQERALVAKEGIKQRREQQAARRQGVDFKAKADCGTVDIGNDERNKKGSGRIAEREKTVIVTGPVINTANCR